MSPALCGQIPVLRPEEEAHRWEEDTVHSSASFHCGWMRHRPVGQGQTCPPLGDTLPASRVGMGTGSRAEDIW